MSERIARRFTELRANRRAGFIAYVTAGDPTPERLDDVLAALEQAGADIIELGIPFSDPLADGPTIQAASGRALAAGMTVRKALDAVRDFRRRSDVPIVLFTYLNPIYSFGFERFVAGALAVGADGLLVLDMPPEEQEANAELVAAGGLDPIRLVAPTTPPGRMGRICASARGFIYYVSREGVTGERPELAGSIAEQVAALRIHTALPVAVGFGISTPAQASAVARVADAVVVGSAIVRRIAELGDASGLGPGIEEFVRPLADAAHGGSAQPATATGPG